MNNANDIKKIFEKAVVETNPSKDEKILENITAAYKQTNKARPEKVELNINIWRTIMKSPIIKLTVAAVIIIAAVIGISYFLSTSGGPAWADVIKPIFTAETVKYDMIIGQEGSGAVITDMVKGSKIRRNVEGTDQASIIDLESSKVMVLEETTKTVFYIDLKNLPSIPNYTEHLKNLITKLESSPEFRVQKLGEKVVDGKEAVGFLATCEGAEVTIWADAKTAVPIRIEQKEPNLNVICKNYQFDIEMDDSLFSMDVPSGYQLQQLQIDLQGTEENFIAGLKMLAEISDDKTFPQDVSLGYIAKNALNIGQQIDKVITNNEQAVEMGLKLGNMLAFIRFFKGEGQWHYAGDGVKLGDASKAIFWYQPKDSETWRVIYGDLTVMDVNEEDLP